MCAASVRLPATEKATPREAKKMSTAQLVVVGYAAIAVECVLLYRALDGSASALILAILVAAASLVYFLKPHPLAKKRRVVALTVLPLVILATWYYAWNPYQDWRRERALEEQSAEYAKATISGWFQQQYRQRTPHGSWIDMSSEWSGFLDAELTKQARAAQQAQQKAQIEARIAARLKVGDRVWVRSDSHIASAAGYYFRRTLVCTAPSSMLTSKVILTAMQSSGTSGSQERPHMADTVPCWTLTARATLIDSRPFDLMRYGG